MLNRDVRLAEFFSGKKVIRWGADKEGRFVMLQNDGGALIRFDSNDGFFWLWDRFLKWEATQGAAGPSFWSWVAENRPIEPADIKKLIDPENFAAALDSYLTSIDAYPPTEA